MQTQPVWRIEFSAILPAETNNRPQRTIMVDNPFIYATIKLVYDSTKFIGEVYKTEEGEYYGTE